VNPKEITGQRKPALALIPSGALIPVCAVHAHGHAKYGPYNWRETPVEAMTYAHAIMRHLVAWIDGEDLDPETGLSHIAHISAGGNIVLDADSLGMLNDNRPCKGRGAELIRAACVTSSGESDGRKSRKGSRAISAGASSTRKPSKSPRGKRAKGCSTR
jgi:hypothetical protein